MGVLRSYDQFGAFSSMSVPCLTFYSTFDIRAANLVLEDTIERIYHGQTYADDPVGLFLIRGENVVLLGEVVCRIFEFGCTV